MNDLEAMYNEVMDSLKFDESSLDYSILERHIETITQISKWSNNSITIYDNFRKEHVWVSSNHKELFGCNEQDDIQIHPDDF